MEFGLREWLIVIGIIVIAGICLMAGGACAVARAN